jgi:hypothetical protein
MVSCEATTRLGKPCQNAAQHGKRTCYVHRGFVVGVREQTKVVNFAEEAAHTFVIISQMKQRFCTTVQLPPDVKRRIEDKEKVLAKFSHKMEKLARKSARKNVEANVDSVIFKFKEERKELYKLIYTHCKRELNPPYVAPDNPPPLDVVADMLRREGPTEMRYVNHVGSFFTIFLEWSVYGVTKTPRVLKFLVDYWPITVTVVTYFSYKYPQTVGKRIPVYKQIIETLETTYSVYGWGKQVVSDLVPKLDSMMDEGKRILRNLEAATNTWGDFLEKVSRPISSIANFPKTLRVLADRILAKRKGSKISRQRMRQLDQAKLDLAVRLWEHQKNLPDVPDNVLLMLEGDPGRLHLDDTTLASYYDTGAKMDQDVFSVVSMIGMVFLFFRRRLWR